MTQRMNGQPGGRWSERDDDRYRDRHPRGLSLFVIMLFFGLLLWGRLRLRDDVTKVVVAEPKAAHQVDPVKSKRH